MGRMAEIWAEQQEQQDDLDTSEADFFAWVADMEAQQAIEDERAATAAGLRYAADAATDVEPVREVA